MSFNTYNQVFILLMLHNLNCMLTCKSSLSTIIELSGMIQSTNSIVVQQIDNVTLTKFPERHTTSKIGNMNNI